MIKLHFLLAAFIFLGQCSLYADTRALKEKLNDNITPLQEFSYHFTQEMIEIVKIDEVKYEGTKFLCYLPIGTPLLNLATNKAIHLQKPMNVQVLVPNKDLRIAYLLNKNGEIKYQTRTYYVSDLTKDLDLAPTPKNYVESPPMVKSNKTDYDLGISTSFFTHLGVIHSSYFLNFGELTTAASSGFGVKSVIDWGYVKPIIQVSYTSFSLPNVILAAFASWKYGLGLEYNLSSFEQETNISLTILGDFQYRGTFGETNLTLSSNTMQLGLERQATSQLINFSYGATLSREQLSIRSGHDFSFDPHKKSIYTLSAHIGFNLDLKI